MDYFDRLEAETHHLYEIANKARSKGLDVETTTEVPLAKDLAERVEGLVGPEGVAQRIKELEQDITREEVAFEIAAEIASGKFELTGEKADWNEEQRCDQGLRTALAILTEGVVAAPLEGISQVKIKQNFDGTKYIGVYFAGPIRSAGGTAAALAVLLGDKIRQAIGIDEFKPIDDEIERYVEEVELYESEVTNLQYSPTPEEVRFAANHIPVEVSGEQTDQVEVSHRDLERVETNNIRGGALLAMVEGVIQKSKKIHKISKKLGLDWEWLSEYSKPKKDDSSKDEGESDIISEPKYIQDIIGGRPILGYPSEKGGFRLRYGRSRNTGLATMGVHPATMALLEFLAVGTQLKIEYPGKGNCVVPVDSIEGPTVKLKNGDVVIIDSVRQARELKKDVVEILFLGDMLVAFGEFLRNNQPLYPSGWCEEWWIQLLMRSENFDEDNNDLDLHKLEYEYLTSIEAFTLSKKYNIPLHPKYTYCYNDVTIQDLNNLIDLIEKGKSTYKQDEGIKLDLSFQKRTLEVIGVPHTVRDGKIVIDKDHAYALLVTLSKRLPQKESTIEAINEVSPVEIKNKAPAYIGTRVGRPEKSKERLMRPAPHGLFPIGNNGGTRRLVATAAKKGNIKIDISRRKCTNPECGISSFGSLCPKCGAPTEMGKPSQKSIPLASMLKKASDNVKVRRVDEFKGVMGMISESKIPEPLEKGILRAKNEVFTFKDGTIRHDSTDLPLTHFIPKEIGVTVDKLLEMGYDKDCYGNPIENEDQIIELKVQDIVISDNCGEYLLHTAQFIDDELTRYYGMDAFYNVKEKSDLIGHLVAGLAPHTSAGVLGRIVGFTKALGCYAHPYFHSAKRRNCDSDEDAVMLLLDALINFSKSYLPNTRGGSMDAPLVLSSRIDPEEIDDESHNLDIFERFPVEFYEETYTPHKPAEVLEYIDNVEKHLGTPEQYEGLMFSHHTSNIHAGPTVCLYKRLPSMREKVEAQISLAETIRAVDQRGVVEKVLSSHFLPDIMGNSRAFSKQKVRCTKCGAKYRRMPLTGKCRCGGNLILSVSKGSVTKYLEISQELVNRYPVSHYLKQRLEIQEYGINSLFESDKSKQSSLDVFF
ncbi:MAG: DNA polymerase II large subunit [Methanobrevibacter sp.]|uniref:DNA polymerase II large subunit n=1 Tax=Methanobrevibacter sp. TaxID=66852 RepID=UPI0025EF56FF|nr:DNA polymerase II large subunit [Methanobrevibacter sp.]MBR3112898.1 DNA polymerase II large subunit [Methanobrevibacter sp.]MBR6992768.1 DNA polymerase II large subunit [Methanobrevibacter sp.]